MKRAKRYGAAAAAFLALSVWLGGVATAAPMQSDLQTRLMALFQRWEALLAAGKFADAAAISVPELSKQIADTAKSKDDADGLSAMAKEMTPDSLVTRHASVSKDGKQAVIITLASKKIPADAKPEPDGPKPGSVVQSEITLKFTRDGNDWKFAEQMFGMDPAEIKHCHDDATETLSSYDQGRSLNAGGLIRQVDYKPDHTLLVFRVLDEEDCAVLPPKDQLTKSGADLTLLAPYALIEFNGYPHKSDKQRLWARDWKITPEE